MNFQFATRLLIRIKTPKRNTAPMIISNHFKKNIFAVTNFFLKFIYLFRIPVLRLIFALLFFSVQEKSKLKADYLQEAFSGPKIFTNVTPQVSLILLPTLVPIAITNAYFSTFISNLENFYLLDPSLIRQMKSF